MANFPSAYYNDVRAGLEWRYQDRFALRGGYRLDVGASADDRLGGPTFGFGTGANGLWLDYAFLAGSNGAPASHRLGLTLRPGQWMGLHTGLASQADHAGDDDSQPVTQVTPRASASSSATQPKAAAASREALQTPEPAVAAAKPSKRAEPPAASAPPVAAEKPWAVSVEATASPGETAARAKPTTPRALEASAPAMEVAPAQPPADEPPRASTAPAAADAGETHPAPAKPAENAKAPVAKRPLTVTVQSGQTLADIAEQWQTSVPALMMENNLVSEKVKAGKSLKLPPPSRR